MATTASEDLVADSIKWIGELTGQPLPSLPLEELVENGLLLERVANVLQQRHQKKKAPPFKRLTAEELCAERPRQVMNSVSSFLKVCEDLGCEQQHMCTSADVVEHRSVGAVQQVARTLAALSRRATALGLDRGARFPNSSSDRTRSSQVVRGIVDNVEQTLDTKGEAAGGKRSSGGWMWRGLAAVAVCGGGAAAAAWWQRRGLVYVVQEGDTLTNVLRQTQPKSKQGRRGAGLEPSSEERMETFLAANPLVQNPNKIYPNQKLSLKGLQ